MINTNMNSHDPYVDFVIRFLDNHPHLNPCIGNVSGDLFKAFLLLEAIKSFPELTDENTIDEGVNVWCNSVSEAVHIWDQAQFEIERNMS